MSFNLNAKSRFNTNESQSNPNKSDFFHNPTNQNTNQGKTKNDMDFSDFLTSERVAKFSQDFAKDQINSSIDKLQSQIESSLFKSYFSVDNNFVMKKLLRIFFPYRIHNWERSRCVNERNEEIFSTPREDINAFDLYIPVLSFVTYILLLSVSLAIGGQSFTPEFFLKKTTTSFIIFSVELMLTKAFVHLIQSKIQFFDLISLIGYKFVPINANLIVFIFFGTWAYYVCWVFTSVSIVFFVKNTFQNVKKDSGLINDNVELEGNKAFTVVEAIIQPLLCFVYGLI